LAERANDDYEFMEFDFPDEDLMAVFHIGEEPDDSETWTIYFDGASNATDHGIRAVLTSPDGNHFAATARLDFRCTNNVAEYEACVLGIQMAIERRVEILKVYGDSALVIYQLKGEWEIRDSKLFLYHDYIKDLMKNFKEIYFQDLSF